MTLTMYLYAQPYNIEATGFYFSTLEEYESKSANLRDRHGCPVEEFELQWTDGEEIDRELFEALGVCQATIEAFFEAVDEWDEDTKVGVIMAVGDGCINFTLGKDDPQRDVLDKVSIYQVDSLKELAEQFVDDGLYGPIPDELQGYIDYDAIARDLDHDYSMRNVAGTRYAYSCD